jgi:hypothetical protein
MTVREVKRMKSWHERSLTQRGQILGIFVGVALTLAAAALHSVTRPAVFPGGFSAWLLFLTFLPLQLISALLDTEFSLYAHNQRSIHLITLIYMITTNGLLLFFVGAYCGWLVEKVKRR